MVAANYTTVRNNLKDYCDKATDENEVVVVTRKDDKNVCIISLDMYNQLEKDFEEALSKIDFSKAYDPYSKDFMKPLFIGMLLAAIKLSDDDVKDELNGARTYWNKYLETSDSQYRDMAYDELKHAGILLKKYEKERQELLEAVGDV